MTWRLFKEQEAPDRTGIPLLPAFILTIVVVAVCLTIRAVTWPGNKHVDLSFFMQAVAFPVIVIALVLQFSRFMLSSTRHYDEVRVAIAQMREYELKKYAGKHLVMAGWNTLTPLQEPALNMLKLEGEFPLAPKTPLSLPRDDIFEVTQNEQLFRQLLLPLADKLKNDYRQFDSVMWVRGGDESCSEELRRALESLNIKPGKITFLPDCPDYSLINKWVDNDSGFIIHRLVILVDLHNENADEKEMENVCAFLLTNQYVSIEGDKPVYLYNPITGITDVKAILPVYLQVGPVESPKTLWYTGLSKVEKYALMQVLDERKLAPNRLEMELSLGTLMKGYRWLALLLAADAIKYAQGAQFVAASEGNRLGMIALSSRQADYFQSPSATFYPTPLSEGAVFGLLLSFAVIFGIITFGEPNTINQISGWFIVSIVVIFALSFTCCGAFFTWYLGEKAEAHMWGY